MGNIWFTADEHYDHDNIIKFCKRPFKNTSEMQETLITNHNSVVKKGDTVFHLGDMFWRTVGDSNAIKIVQRLNGEQLYVYGNHDEVFRNPSLRAVFGWCKDVYNLKVQGFPNIWLAHYAHRVWNGSHRGAWHLYGHTHAELPEDGSLSCDVGVDAWNYFPVNIEEIRMKMQEFSKRFLGKTFVCKNEKCGNKFVPFHTRPSTCAKCGTEMELR